MNAAQMISATKRQRLVVMMDNFLSWSVQVTTATSMLRAGTPLVALFANACVDSQETVWSAMTSTSAVIPLCSSVRPSLGVTIPLDLSDAIVWKDSLAMRHSVRVSLC